MTPTPDLIARLRRLTDEQIPAGGAETDTRFLDTELADILAQTETLEEAAAEVWELKAARAYSERGGLEESRAGDEVHRFTSLKDYREHCLQMAALYRRKARPSGSRLLAFEPPDVLGTGAMQE